VAGGSAPYASTAGFQKATTTTISPTNAKMLTIVTPTGSGFQLASPQASAAWYVCVYESSTTGANLISQTASAAYTIMPSIAVAPAVGHAGGGATIVATASAGTLAATNSVEFQYVGTGAAATCAPTYVTPAPVAMTNGNQTAGAIAVPTASVTQTTGQTTKLNIVVPAGVALGTGQTSQGYNVCIYAGTTAGSSAIVAGTVAPYTISGNLTLNTNVGPSAGSNTITATTDATFPSTAAVSFQYVGTGAAATCAATWTGTVAIAVAGTPPVQSAGVVPVSATNAVRVLSPTKLSILVPAALVLSGSPLQTSADYHVCVYADNSTGALIASTTTPYTIMPVVGVSNVAPATGPSQGGTVITVTGTNLPQTLTATLGGVALTGISVATNGGTFTATTPQHAPAANVPLVVTAGSQTITYPSAFSYSNGIVVMPKTAPNTGRVNLDVTGVGFSGLAFSATDTNGGTPRAATPHVYLVVGVYDPTVSGSDKTNPEIQECTDVLVISDNELVCRLDLSASLTATEVASVSPVPNGTYTVTVVDTGAIAATATVSKSIVSSGSTFTVAPF
jgi:hypothetical protein